MNARLLEGLVLAVGILTGIGACHPSQLPPGALTSPPAWRPECPGGDTFAITLVDSTGERRRLNPIYYTHTVTQVPLAGDRSNVPEFHDCQRFLIGGDGGRPFEYDSLYAIFAADHFHQQELADSTDTLSYSSNKRGWPSGEILSYGGRYTTLGIEPDFNCLYLWRELASWKARMVPIGTHEQSCDRPLSDPARASGTELEVRPYSDDKASSEDYPEAARWDWDSVHLKQYIGLRCGASWCEVGAKGFAPSAFLARQPVFVSAPGPNPTTGERKRNWTIKGWYDQQLLAAWDSVRHKPVPGRVWGTIIPHPVLGRPDHNVPGYFNPWVAVANVTVTDDYSTKYVHFKKGQNYVWLCSGTNCPGASTTTACPSSTGIVWHAKMQPATGGDPFSTCVIMRDHSNPTIPGTTRWRWAESDETGWIRCTGGCCEVH